MDADEIDSLLGEELSEMQQASVEHEEASVDTVEVKEVRKRGRPLIPAKWLTVMSLDHDNPLKMNIKEVASDLALAQAERRVPNTRRDRQWAPIFCPRKFITDNNNLDLENFRFSPAMLENYGISISKLRRRI